MSTRNRVLSLLFVLVATLFLMSNSALAQAPQPSEEKTALYTKYYEKRKGNGEEDQKAAYDLAQEFLQKYGSDNDQYTTAVKKFVVKYEELKREYDFSHAIEAKDYTKAFAVGKEILSKDPDNFSVLVRLVEAGSLNWKAGNPSLNADATAYGKHALELLQANKVTSPAPMANLDDANGYINRVLGSFYVKDSPAEAEPYFKAAVQTKGAYHTDPTTYFLLGSAIFNGQYQTLYNEYQAKFAGKDESPEQKALLDKITQTGDRAIDAMARAVALSTKPEQQEAKKEYTTQLTGIYKDFHKGSDAGLKELIEQVLTKPLP